MAESKADGLNDNETQLRSQLVLESKYLFGCKEIRHFKATAEFLVVKPTTSQTLFYSLWRFNPNNPTIPVPKIHEWLVDHRLILIHLSPYSPELNPIEIVRKQAKYHWRRIVTCSKEQLAQEVGNLIDGVGTDFIINFA